MDFLSIVRIRHKVRSQLYIFHSGQVVYYFDHDIPIKNAAQFLNEIEKRAKPGEITVIQQIKGRHVKFEDKWIHDGWRLYCYDDYKSSFEYNPDIRFERLVDGHFRQGVIFMKGKSLQLYLRDTFHNQPKNNWSEFIKTEDSEHIQKGLGQLDGGWKLDDAASLFYEYCGLHFGFVILRRRRTWKKERY